jgi:hypothetical protein
MQLTKLIVKATLPLGAFIRCDLNHNTNYLAFPYQDGGFKHWVKVLAPRGDHGRDRHRTSQCRLVASMNLRTEGGTSSYSM